MKKLILLCSLLLLCVNTQAFAITALDELQDVPTTHWAYSALKNLAEKYDAIEGYEDDTFKGESPSSRYEMAAILNKVASKIGQQMAELGIEKADQKDLEAVVKLQQEFSKEIAAFKLRAEAIEIKNDEQDQAISDNKGRLDFMDKVKQTRDMTLLFASDQGGSVDNATSTTLRARYATEIAVVEDNPDGFIGKGTMYSRIIGAIGRVGPLGSSLVGSSLIGGYNDIATDAFGDTSAPTAGGYALTKMDTFIEQAYYKQEFHPQSINDFTLTFVGGLIDPTQGYLDINAVANDEGIQFMSAPFVNNPSAKGLGAEPGILVIANKDFKDGKFGLKYTLGAFTLGPTTDTVSNMSYTHEIGLKHNITGNHEGNIRVGFNHTSFRGGTNSLLATTINPVTGLASPSNSTFGFYVSADQAIAKQMKLFTRYGATDAGTASRYIGAVKNAWSTGIEIPASIAFKSRDKDVFAIAVGGITPSETLPSGFINLHDEKAMEMYYRFQLNDYLAISPDIQVIWSPGGQGAPVSTALGIRTHISF